MKKYLIALLIVILVIFFCIIGVAMIGFNNGERVYARALEDNNPALCENIYVIPKLRFADIPEIFMYFLFAIPDKTQSTQVGCYMKIAKQTNSTKACELINRVYAGRCYIQLVSEKVESEFVNNGCREDLEPAGNVGVFEVCYEKIKSVVITHYKNICEQATELLRKDNCYFAAMNEFVSSREAKIFISLCDNINNEDSRELCRKSALIE